MERLTDLDLDIEERSRLLDAWVDTRRRIAALEAEAAELLAARLEAHDADAAESPFHRDAIHRSMIAEYSAAGHLPQGTVESAFADAHALQHSLPAVRASFAAGAIGAAHVREIVRAGALVAEAIRNGRADAGTMALYEAAVLVVAEADTAARTRPRARQIAAALAGDTVTDRLRRAEDERCVTVRSIDDGLALLTAVLPEWLATAIADRLTAMARQVVASRGDREPALDPAALRPGDNDLILPDDIAHDDPLYAAIFADDTFITDPLAGLVDPLTCAAHSPDVEHLPVDERTIDQVRADLLTDLLLVGDPSVAQGTALDGIQARVQVTVAASTLAGADDRPAELDGHGPLHPDVARAIAGRSTGWSRLFLDPAGMVVETDTYTPTERMRRHLRARDQHCRFPGCRMPAHRCEIDHNHDHAKGGRTRIDNLSHFCTAHHSLKHPDVDARHRWTARQSPDGGIDWISPLGRTYTDPPPRRVMFV